MSFERDAFQGNALQPGGPAKPSVTAFQGTQSDAFQVGKGAAASGDTVVPRSAVFAPRMAAPQFGGVSVTANLLLTTLAVAAVTFPVGESSQEMPVRKPAIQHEVGRTSLALTNVPLVPYLPGEATAPNPRKEARQQPEPKPNTLPLTYVAPPADTSTLWRMAVVSPRNTVKQPQQEVGTNWLIRQAVVAAGSPFKQLDWPNPRVKAKAGGVEIGPSLIAQLYYIYPYAPSDSQWPLPVVARKVQQPEVVQNVLLRGIPPPAVVTKPFLQSDWQNPIGRKPGQTLDGQNALPLGVAPPPPDSSTLFRVGVFQPKVEVRQPFQWSAQNLLPLLETPVTPVTPVVPDVGGGGGWIKYGPRPKRLKGLSENVRDWVDEIYSELTAPEMPKEVRAEAGKVVKEFAKSRAKVPDVARVDWDLLIQEAQAVRRLIALWNAYVELQEAIERAEVDDEETILGMIL